MSKIKKEIRRAFVFVILVFVSVTCFGAQNTPTISVNLVETLAVCDLSGNNLKAILKILPNRDRVRTTRESVIVRKTKLYHPTTHGDGCDFYEKRHP